MTPQHNTCENLNHRRANVPVRHCPQCGELVNRQVTARPCNDIQHAAARRQMTAFCFDCGTQLINAR